MEASRMFARTVDLLGEEGFARLRAARVLVVGLGGVGSHCALALARAGVGSLRLCDFDRVTWTSLNRHAVAGPADVGRLKAEVLAERLGALAPGLAAEPVVTFFHEDTAPEVLGLDAPPSHVVDAIDSFNPKVALLRRCVAEAIPVVSCMGASARVDPTLMRIGDIGETRVCPLARVVRVALRRHGIHHGITTIYSVEPPLRPLPPDEEDEVLRRGRVRNRLPSLGVMPGIFGYAAAGLVIRRLAG
jgi:tRNA threonylcarbamoyladenosine dehydratase